MEEMMGSWDKRRRESSEDEEEQVLKLPGFRFHPTDEELVGFYLSKKVHLKKPSKIDEIISQIDIYKFDPWDLPSKFFFTPFFLLFLVLQLNHVKLHVCNKYIVMFIIT